MVDACGRAVPRIRLYGLGLTFAAVLAGAGATLTASPQEKGAPPAAAGGDGALDILHVSACKNCHVTEPGPDKSAWHRFAQFETWNFQDRHSISGLVLKGALGQQMQAQLVKMDESWKGKSVETDIRCISCHNPELAPGDAQASIGVECGTCHGATGKWLVPHFNERARWASLSDGEKTKRGFKPLHDPKVRGELCNSCHVGDGAQSRVVTHDMYAAGHPPLPSFELSHMSETAYLKHWRPSNDPYKLAPQYAGEDAGRPAERERFTKQAAEAYQARLVVVGGVESLRSSLSVLGADAHGKNKAKSLDFAQFDCYACHHSLTTPSYRQKWAAAESELTGYGRPPLQYWPQLLARVAFRHAGADEKELDELLKDVKSAVAAQNFGDAEKVATAARAASAKLAEKLPALSKSDNFAPAKAKSLLRELVRIGVEDGPAGRALLDYDSCRQLAWAIRSVLAEPNYKGQFSDELAKALDFSGLQKGDSKSRLDLSLPSRQAEGRPGEKDTLLVDHLPNALKVRAEFQPDAFRAQLATAWKLLEKGGADAK